MKLFWCIVIPIFFIALFHFRNYIFRGKKETDIENMAFQDFQNLSKEIENIIHPEQIHEMEDEIVVFENYYANKISRPQILYYTASLYDKLTKINFKK